MKFLCDRAKLEAAIAPILPAIPTKEPQKPALGSIALRAGGDELVLRGSNLDLSVEMRIEPVKVDEPGGCLIPAKPFAALVHEIPDPTVRIEGSDSKIVLPTSTGRFEMVAGDAADFPDLEFADDAPGFEVPISMLVRHFQATEFACAREAARYAMNGILLSGRDGKFVTVATDGRRLALISSTLEQAGQEEVQALLPHRSLSAIVHALDALSDEKVSVHFGDASVCLAVSQGRFSTQRVMGAFPDYDNVVPRGCANTVEFNRALLEANLRRAIVLTDEINPSVKITFEGSQAKFESEATGVGSAETVMDVDLSGDGGHIMFNPHFVVEVLRVAQQDLVRFEFDDAQSPGKFVLGEEFVYVVMPITGV